MSREDDWRAYQALRMPGSASYENGRFVWTCGGCGKRETWGKGWRRWPGVVHEDGIAMVACCDACEDVVLQKAMGGKAER